MRHALFLLAACASLHAATPAKLDFGSVREEHLMIPMRDGKRLSAYVFFPKGEGKWPAIFEQRYADISSAGSRKAAAKFAEGGFVIALVNYRGTHESEGVYRGYRGLQWGPLRDGYDVCEWLAAQPWCTGKIGTYGGSQAGYAQNYLAVTQPPHLVAQYMTDTGLSLYQEGYRIGGATKPQRFIKGGAVAREIKDNEDMLREWDQHPDYDAYWKDEDASLHFDKMNYPCFTIGSWFDFMCQGSVASFIGRNQQGGPHSRGHQQLIIGPWLHGGYPKSNKIGELVFPENAMFDVYAHMTNWFNHYLKGEDNGIEKDTPVKYYVMGATGEEGAPGNVWREAKDFPPASKAADWFLQPDGKLTTGKPGAARASTSYASDPEHPMSLPYTGFPGARDARGFEEQAEVRTWTSEVLAEPLEVTGRIKAEVFVSSTAKDTDFFLRVTDVYPDGRSILLVDYPLRARYHEGFDHQKLLVPGEITKLAWDIGWTSIIFNKGHRIRITIASTGAPYYEPNPQTGGPISHFITGPGVPAINTIWHDSAHASRVILPIIK
ncbi:CocE/NonD family hydrolase [Prosthecobacter sp.]|uniref:CocE/NonD family hydrolase n=1 Tax=Prosthecobacter sp. TaxID=1965333 RepID=UPI0037838956